MILGIAGKSGSGKNLLADYLESKGFTHYDLDIWAHRGLEYNQARLIQIFGDGIADGNGLIDRKKLGALVFSSLEKREELQSVIYPWLEEVITREIAGKSKILLNGALLSESPIHRLCDHILWVKSPILHRLIRLVKRDKIHLFRILHRMRSQNFLKPQLFSAESDIHIVMNNSSVNQFFESIDSLIDTWERRNGYE